MFDKLAQPWLLAVFAVSAIAIWLAGTKLSRATDVLAGKLKLGDALGGMILLAVVTNLPEIAITVTASLQGKTELAVGNILGGIGIQTVVLVILDRFGLPKTKSLTNQVNTLSIVLEGLLVIAILTIVIIGTQLPAGIQWKGITVQGPLIVITWMAGLYLINQAKKGLPWKAAGAVDSAEKNDDSKDQGNTTRALAVFALCAAITLIAGFCIEQSGDALANKWGMTGVVFGATILAAATSLPEVSTGLAAMKLKDYPLAISDIFGGNAFLPVLFLLAGICSGKAVLPTAKKSDIYLTAVAMLLTIIYLAGIIFRSKKKFLGMGLDSFLVLLAYLLSIAGLFAVS